LSIRPPYQRKDITLPADTSNQKSLRNKDNSITELVEWATAGAESIEDMIEIFGKEGVAYSTGEEITHDYRLITGDEKQAFLIRVAGQRVFIVKWKFITPPSQREFVALHFIINGAGKFILNDSSKSGIYDDLTRVTENRIRNGKSPSEACTGLDVPRGFKRNKDFYYRTACEDHGTTGNKETCEVCARVGKSIPATELENVGAAFKDLARPTWKLEF
jgi:hypothetical protein